MRVVLSKRIAQEIVRIYAYHIASSKVNEFFSYGVNEGATIPRNLDNSRREAKIIKSKFPQFSEDEVIEYKMIEELLEYCLSGENRSMVDMFLERVGESIKVFYPDEFSENPYIKNIRIDTTWCDRFRLDYSHFDPFELFFYDTAELDDELVITIPHIGCFAEKFYYPSILEKAGDTSYTWMSVTPNEVYTMEKQIAHARGNVLTLGCGMGYFAYMVSLKEDVTSVTIVECEQEVIDLFQKYILPQFEYKDKITIVKGDAVEYLRDMTDGEFDYCFADIWRGVNDLEPYFAVKEIGRNFKKTQMEYWIEDSIAIYLSEFVWIEILETFFHSNDILLPYTPQARMSIMGYKAGNYVKRLLEHEEISRVDHIRYYLKPENIIFLINKTNIVF